MVRENYSVPMWTIEHCSWGALVLFRSIVRETSVKQPCPRVVGPRRKYGFFVIGLPAQILPFGDKHGGQLFVIRPGYAVRMFDGGYFCVKCEWMNDCLCLRIRRESRSCSISLVSSYCKVQKRGKQVHTSSQGPCSIQHVIYFCRPASFALFLLALFRPTFPFSRFSSASSSFCSWFCSPHAAILTPFSAS